MAGGEVGGDDGPEGLEEGVGDRGVGGAGGLGLGEAAQEVDADAEGALLHPGARGVEGALVVVEAGEAGGEAGAELRGGAERAVEVGGDDGVEDAGVGAEVAGELGRGAADVDEEVEERRVRLHQREELHARGEAGQEGVERVERRVGGGGLGDAAQELGLEAAEDGAGALGAEGGQALPRGHAGAGGVGIGEDRVGGGGGGRGAVLGEEGLGQLLHAGEAARRGWR